MKQAGSKLDDVSICAGIGNAADELRELDRADNFVRDAGSLDQLGADIAVVGWPVGGDDGSCNVVTNVRYAYCCEKVAAGSLEKFQHRLEVK